MWVVHGICRAYSIQTRKILVRNHKVLKNQKVTKVAVEAVVIDTIHLVRPLKAIHT